MSVQSSEISSCEVPGQTVLPGMADDLGYEAIVLKPFQERFCWEFVLKGDNAMRAYKIVKPGVKDSTARVEASKLLTIPAIQQRISQIKTELKRRYTVTADDLMQYHGKVLKVDRAEFLDANGKPKKIDDIDPEAASILEFDCERDPKGNVHVLFKVPQRHQSAVELARIMGMHKNSMELMGKDGAPIQTESAITIYIPANGRD